MITEGKVVSMSYLLKDDQGQVLDQATAEAPFSYVHGIGDIVPGLEKGLEGKSAGEKESITIEPENAYGDVMEELQLEVDRAQFPENVDLQVGMQFTADVGGNQVPFMVTGLENDKVQIDGNHPLAGKRLHFDVEIHEVRDATAEEKENGLEH